MRKLSFVYWLKIFFIFIFVIFTKTASADFISGETLLTETESLPYYLKDRGTGIPTSMFGTYITKGQIFVYPFFELYNDSDMEYSPDELGYNLVHDYKGKYRASEGLIFFGYGITDWLAIEFETAVISAELEKSDDDTSGMPNKLKESGLGDVEGQIRWRWAEENERWPELFSYFETVFPLQKDKVLIGTQDWEYKLGIGAVKGFTFGTLTVRLATEYDRSENKTELGEYAVEYLKKLSSRWRIYGGIEGSQDEVEVITEAQLHLNRNMFFKFNNAFGATAKATDWAPEIGIVFSF
ncbi:hypothetical protein ACFL1R_06415 [Candidatus Latescibacterota bacterium]